jgi:hypothetical protein
VSAPNPLAGRLPQRLGCATSYTVLVHYWDRRTRKLQRYTELTGITEITWERVLDDFSEARINFKPSKGDACCDKIKPRFDRAGNLVEPGIWPWAHEISIYRDGELVWQGPIFSVDETVMPDQTTDHIQITARDFLGWLDRRAIHSDIMMNDHDYDLVDIAKRIVIDAFTPDDMGVLQYLTTIPSVKTGTHTVRKWEARASDELREIARGGLDYTSVGRTILIRGARQDTTKNTIKLRGSDFQGGIEIRVVGSEAATAGIAVGGQPTTTDGTASDANTPPAKAYWFNPARGAVDPFFGLIENWTQSESVTSQSFLTWVAQQKVLEGYPPPYTLSVPADTGLNADAPVSIHHLVPSTYFTLLIEGTCRSIQQFMRLSHVRVTWSAEQAEQVGVTFIPANIDDDTAGGDV